MEITDRFARQWERWDREVRDRSTASVYLEGATDEDLIELLAGASGAERKYERDIVATEILNRLRRRQRALPAAADDVLRSAEAAYQAAAEGQKAIHKAESLLKARGDQDLGSAVSASAYASLDTTKLAFEAAQQNSQDVQAVITQSRIAHQLAEDAAEVARGSSEATAAVAPQLAAEGHHEAARAAQEAAARIADAAEDTLAATKAERAAEGD